MAGFWVGWMGVAFAIDALLGGMGSNSHHGGL